MERNRNEADVQGTDLTAPSSDLSMKVLFIAGEGRSGSTILSAILGNREGYLPVGELPDVWQALKTNELCGCGLPFASCPFWQEIGNVAFGGWDTVDVEEVLRQQATYTRHRRIPHLIWQSHKGRPDATFRTFCERLGQLYQAINDVSGCSVIVDSTKSPPFARLLRNVPGIDLRVIHLVRDSRGVAFSWRKRGIKNLQYRDHPTLKDQPMATMSAWKSALWWDLKNLLLHVLIPADQRLLILYENFTAESNCDLNRIFEFAGAAVTEEKVGTAPHPGYRSMPFHTLGGNRVRFARGIIDVRNDMEWLLEMPMAKKLVVGALTLPLLIAYRYPVLPRAKDGRVGTYLQRTRER